MLNSEPIETGPAGPNIGDALVQNTPSQDTTGPYTLGPYTPSPYTPRGGSAGAIALAGLATFVVVAIWFVFYLLVFLPRAGAP